jgi:hypothetical protein
MDGPAALSRRRAVAEDVTRSFQARWLRSSSERG